MVNQIEFAHPVSYLPYLSWQWPCNYKSVKCKEGSWRFDTTPIKEQFCSCTRRLLLFTCSSQWELL